jgi:hypothetical protein
MNAHGAKVLRKHKHSAGLSIFKMAEIWNETISRNNQNRARICGQNVHFACRRLLMASELRNQ